MEKKKKKHPGKPKLFKKTKMEKKKKKHPGKPILVNETICIIKPMSIRI